MTNPLLDELQDSGKKAEEINGRLSNGDDNNSNDKNDSTKPVIADQQKLLAPFLQSATATAGKDGKQIKIEEAEDSASNDNGSDGQDLDILPANTKDKFNGLLVSADGKTTIKIIANQLFNANGNFLGTYNDGFFEKPSDNGTSNLRPFNSEFNHYHFIGTENGKFRQFEISSANCTGSVLFSFEDGTRRPCIASMGMLIDEDSSEQFGFIEAPTEDQYGKITGGTISIITGDKLETKPLPSFRGLSFNLLRDGQTGSIGDSLQGRLKGVCLGHEVMPNGQIRPDQGILNIRTAINNEHTVHKNIEAKLQGFQQAIDETVRVEQDLFKEAARKSAEEHYANQMKELQAKLSFSEKRSNEFTESLTSTHITEAHLNHLRQLVTDTQFELAPSVLAFAKQKLDIEQALLKPLPKDSKTIQGDVLVQGKNGKVETWSIVNGTVYSATKTKVGDFEGTGGLIRLVNTKEQEPPHYTRMSSLHNAVWHLNYPNNDAQNQSTQAASGQMQKVDYISLQGQLIDPDNALNHARAEHTYASRINQQEETKESKKSVQEAEQRLEMFQRHLAYILKNGIQDHITAEKILARNYVRPESLRQSDSIKIEHLSIPIPVPKLDQSMLAQSTGNLRIGVDVYRLKENGELYQYKDNNIHAGIEASSCGKLKPNYLIQLNGQPEYSLASENRVLLELQTKEGASHRLIGLGPGHMTDNFGYITGGLLDIKELERQCAKDYNEALRGNKEYFDHRPYLVAWMDGGDDVLKGFANNIERHSKQVNTIVNTLFNDGFNSNQLDNNHFDLNIQTVQSLLTGIGAQATDVNTLTAMYTQNHSIAIEGVKTGLIMTASATIEVLSGGAATPVIAPLAVSRLARMSKLVTLGGKLAANGLAGGTISTLVHSAPESNSAANFKGGIVEGITIGLGGQANRFLGGTLKETRQAVKTAEALNALSIVPPTKQAKALQAALDSLTGRLVANNASNFSIHTIRTLVGLGESAMATTGFTVAHELKEAKPINLEASSIRTGTSLMYGAKLVGKWAGSFAKTPLAKSIIDSTTNGFAYGTSSALPQSILNQDNQTAMYLRIPIDLLGEKTKEQYRDWGAIWAEAKQSGVVAALTNLPGTLLSHSIGVLHEKSKERTQKAAQNNTTQTPASNETTPPTSIVIAEPNSDLTRHEQAADNKTPDNNANNDTPANSSQSTTRVDDAHQSPQGPHLNRDNPVAQTSGSDNSNGPQAANFTPTIFPSENPGSGLSRPRFMTPGPDGPLNGGAQSPLPPKQIDNTNASAKPEANIEPNQLPAHGRNTGSINPHDLYIDNLPPLRGGTPDDKEMQAAERIRICNLSGKELRSYIDTHPEISDELFAALVAPTGLSGSPKLRELSPEQIVRLANTPERSDLLAGSTVMQSLYSGHLEKVVTPNHIAKFTPKQLCSFDNEQLAAIFTNPANIAAVTDEQFTALLASRYTDRSYGSILSFIGSDNIVKLVSTDGRYESLAASELFSSIPPKAFRQLMTPERVANLTESQLSAIMEDRLRAIFASRENLDVINQKQFLVLASKNPLDTTYRPSKLSRLPYEQVAVLVEKPGNFELLVSRNLLKDLGTDHLKQLITPERLSQLTAEQLYSLGTDALNAIFSRKENIDSVSDNQFQFIISNQVKSFKGITLQPEYITALINTEDRYEFIVAGDFLKKLPMQSVTKLITSNRLSNLHPTRLCALDDYTLQAVFSKPDNIAAVTDPQFEMLLHARSSNDDKASQVFKHKFITLPVKQVVQLMSKPERYQLLAKARIIDKLSTECLKSIATPDLIKCLTPASMLYVLDYQYKTLFSRAENIDAVTDKLFDHLVFTGKLGKDLTPEQAARLLEKPSRYEYLVSTGTLNKLSSSQLQAIMTLDRVRDMSPAQLSKFAERQLYVVFSKPEYIATLDAEKLHILNNKQIESILFQPGNIDAITISDEQFKILLGSRTQSTDSDGKSIISSLDPKLIMELVSKPGRYELLSTGNNLISLPLKTLELILTPARISELTPEQVSSFSSERLEVIFSKDDHVDALTSNQVLALAQANLNGSARNSKLTTIVNLGRLMENTEHFKILLSNNLLPDLPTGAYLRDIITPDRLGIMTPQQITDFVKSKGVGIFHSRENLDAITNEQLLALAKVRSHKDGTYRLSELSPEQLTQLMDKDPQRYQLLASNKLLQALPIVYLLEIISPSQLGELSPEQLCAFEPDQRSLILSRDKYVNKVTDAQFLALARTPYGPARLPELGLLPPSTVSKLLESNPSRYELLLSEGLLHVLPAQNLGEIMTPNKVAVLSPDQICAFDFGQRLAIFPPQQTANINEVTDAQFLALASALYKSGLESYHRSKLTELGPKNVGRLLERPGRYELLAANNLLQTLDLESLKPNLTPDRIGQLSSEQLCKFDLHTLNTILKEPGYIEEIADEHVLALAKNDRYLLCKLEPKLITELMKKPERYDLLASNKLLDKLDSGILLNLLTPERVSHLDPEQFASLKSSTVYQILSDPDCLTVVTDQQLLALAKVDLDKNMSMLGRMPENYIAQLILGEGRYDLLASNNLLHGLRNDCLYDIITANRLANLTPEQLNMFDSEQVASILLSPDNITVLKDEQFKVIAKHLHETPSETVVKLLKPSGRYDWFANENLLPTLSEQSLASILTTARFAALKPEQLYLFSTEQLTKLFKNENKIATITAEKFEALAKAGSLNALPDGQLSGLIMRDEARRLEILTANNLNGLVEKYQKYKQELSKRVDKAAEIINDAAVSIKREAEGVIDGPVRPVVILGRDAWPLVPALRNMGIPAQYFLFSRLQTEDPAIAKLWLKEVPPGALVIDTGYAGSILEAIKKFDPTIEGRLICSRSLAWPQLKTSLGLDHSEMVEAIERFPKITGRSSAVTDRGTPVARSTARGDGQDQVIPVTEVIQQNEVLLRALGLNDDGINRYRKFTGLSPKERLGLSPEEIRQHYQRVREAREAQQNAKPPAAVKPDEDEDDIDWPDDADWEKSGSVI